MRDDSVWTIQKHPFLDQSNCSYGCEDTRGGDATWLETFVTSVAVHFSHGYFGVQLRNINDIFVPNKASTRFRPRNHMHHIMTERRANQPRLIVVALILDLHLEILHAIQSQPGIICWHQKLHVVEKHNWGDFLAWGFRALSILAVDLSDELKPSVAASVYSTLSVPHSDQ